MRRCGRSDLVLSIGLTITEQNLAFPKVKPKNKDMKRKPISPGEILNEEFLKPLGITQKKLAEHFCCDYKVINRIINDRSSVTPEMALKLAAAFNTTPDFWLNAQMALDLYRRRKTRPFMADVRRPLTREKTVSQCIEIRLYDHAFISSITYSW